VERGALWSRMDIGEIFTGRMTPLGISFAKHYQYKVHRDCGTSIGLLDLGEPDEYMGYLKGHVYLNVAYTAYLMAQSPPGFDQRPFVQRFSSEEVDVSRYVNPYGERHAHPRHSRARTSAFWAWATVKELLGARRRARHMVASRHAEYDRAQGRPLRPLDLTGLREEMTHALDYFKAMHTGYLPFYINAFGLYGLLEELCKAWLPGVGQHLQNRLKGDMSNLRTVESARDLWALTQSLERYPLARKLVLELPAHQLAQALQDSDEGRNFCRQELDRFMRENGVRAREEMELSHPRWVDDPTYVFQMIKAFLAQGYEVENRLAGHATGQAGQADTEALLRQLGWPKRLVVRRVIALYSGCSRLREDTRMAMITSIWLVRRVLVEVSRRLVAEGVLRDEAELNWLDFQDLITYLNGYASAQALFPRQKIEAGRRRYQSWLDEDEPPLTFIGHAHARATSHPLADDHAALMGLGTSRGCVRARARVIHDLAAQAGELQKGEVIVTRFTDASWTPLFALAAGIVTDIGSMLSHSSIVAREFGIPSVVNTQTATQRIRTGDWLQIDGESGNVQLLGHGEA
jgi:pyruvate,water dikinase